jgi:xanthine/uracil permease
MDDEAQQQSVSWQRWFLWAILHPFLLFGSAVMTALVLAFVVGDNETESGILFFNFLLLVTIGSISSAAQYLLLRRIIEYPAFWVCTGGCITLIAGSLSFLTLAIIPSWTIVGVCTGSIVGLVQWASLRHTLKNAGWWIGIQACTWGILAGTVQWFNH